jgi:ATP-dependent Clp protease adaptor protein ClpS
MVRGYTRGMSTVAPPVRKRKPQPRRAGPGSGSGRPWLVIVLNDDHNTFDGVAFALARTLPGVTFDRGMALADAIHNAGRAIVWTGDRERAELYWEQLAGFGLTMAPLTPAG